MRLDAFLAEMKLYASRTRAERAVKEGCVKINGKVVKKCSYEVSPDDKVECLPDPLRYVSRGALKLEYALKAFGIDVSGLRAIDVGASTGGFTQVLLENGAASVTAVDVGTNQLDPKIAEDPRVLSLEQTDIRTLSPEETGLFDILTCDCSFISLKAIFDACHSLMKDGGSGIFLIKPQFEAGRGAVKKNGIVKDEKTRLACVESVAEAAKATGFEPVGQVLESPVKGGDGNTEYILAVKKRNKPI